MTEKKELIDEIYRTIINDPVKLVVALVERVEDLKLKNVELAKIAVHGIIRTPRGYAKYHNIDKGDYL